MQVRGVPDLRCVASNPNKLRTLISDSHFRKYLHQQVLNAYFCVCRQQRGARAQHRRAWLRARLLRVAVLDVDRLSLDVALRRSGLALGAHGAGALLGHVSLLVQGVFRLHVRPHHGRRRLRRTDRHEPHRRRRVHGELGPQPAAHGDGALRRVLSRRDGRARGFWLWRARLLARQLHGAQPRAQCRADVHLADGPGRLRRKGRAAHPGAALGLWPAARLRVVAPAPRPGQRRSALPRGLRHGRHQRPLQARHGRPPRLAQPLCRLARLGVQPHVQVLDRGRRRRSAVAGSERQADHRRVQLAAALVRHVRAARVARSVGHPAARLPRMRPRHGVERLRPTAGSGLRALLVAPVRLRHLVRRRGSATRLASPAARRRLPRALLRAECAADLWRAGQHAHEQRKLRSARRAVRDLRGGAKGHGQQARHEPERARDTDLGGRVVQRPRLPQLAGRELW